MRLLLWLRRLWDGAAATEPASGDSSAQAPIQPVRWAVVKEPPGPEARAAGPVGVEAWLRARLGDAIRELDAETTGADRTPAFLTLIGQLAGNPEGRLRRPPAAAQRAMSACRREDVSVGTLVGLFENDPALSQAILSRANSAYYSRGGPCLVLQEAIIRQGRQSVHSVLLEQALGSLVFAGGDQWRRVVDQVWSHMVRTAPLARGLASVFDVEPEQAFVLGLLHDIGKLAIFDRMSTLRTAQRAEYELTPSAVSRVLRKLHEPLGGLCALGWQFGDEAARAIAAHHRQPVPAEPEPLTECLWLAERVDIALAQGRPIDLPALWHDGTLSSDPDSAKALLVDLVPQPVAATRPAFAR